MSEFLLLTDVATALQIYIKENWGKNTRRDAVEILVQGEPGGFVSFNGMDWDIYSRNRNAFLNREMVSEIINVKYCGDNE